VKGFDTCAAPSLRVMRKWQHAFSAAAIYLGGPEAACGWGNLSRHWVRAATRLGWALIPTYVGPQAPCTRFSVRIHPGWAEPEGRAAARYAIQLAQALGLRRGAPIYDDMEAYHGRGRCRRPVLAFLDGWTRQLHRSGYRAGVYSSAGAAAEDLGETSWVYGHRIAKPDAVWFGLWDGRANLNGTPYLRGSWWYGHHRIKQYLGGHRRRIHGIRLDIDSDWVYGAVYRGGRAPRLTGRSPGPGALGWADAPVAGFGPCPRTRLRAPCPPGSRMPADRQPDGDPHGTP
jgi:hypothetical protein